MLKDVKQFELSVGDKVGRFLVESDTPISVAKEMLFQWIKELGQIEDHIKNQMELQECQRNSAEPEELIAEEFTPES